MISKKASEAEKNAETVKKSGSVAICMLAQQQRNGAAAKIGKRHQTAQQAGSGNQPAKENGGEKPENGSRSNSVKMTARKYRKSGRRQYQ